MLVARMPLGSSHSSGGSAQTLTARPPLDPTPSTATAPTLPTPTATLTHSALVRRHIRFSAQRWGVAASIVLGLTVFMLWRDSVVVCAQNSSATMVGWVAVQTVRYVAGALLRIFAWALWKEALPPDRQPALIGMLLRTEGMLLVLVREGAGWAAGRWDACRRVRRRVGYERSLPMLCALCGACRCCAHCCRVRSAERCGVCKLPAWGRVLH